jgi:hypothetical protein
MSRISRTMSRISRTKKAPKLHPAKPNSTGWAENTLFLGLCDAASCRPAMRAGRRPG